MPKLFECLFAVPGVHVVTGSAFPPCHVVDAVGWRLLRPANLVKDLVVLLRGDASRDDVYGYGQPG